jgi:hypothetical protein
LNKLKFSAALRSILAARPLTEANEGAIRVQVNFVDALFTFFTKVVCDVAVLAANPVWFHHCTITIVRDADTV